MNFSIWLLMQLKRRNQSQTFLAKEIGIHRQTVVKWMNGETNQVTPDNVDRLAASLAGTDDQTIAKENYRSIIMDLLSHNLTLCPCCGAEVATLSHDE